MRGSYLRPAFGFPEKAEMEKKSIHITGIAHLIYI
jgi:hypothetical protein